MKTNATRKILAAACAMFMTVSSSASVFAAEQFDSSSAQNDGSQPRQEMMQNQPQGEKPDGEPKDQLPSGEMNTQPQGELPQGEKPDGEPKDQLPAGEFDEQLPPEEMNGELPEMKDGMLPGGGFMDEVYKAVSSIADEAVKQSVSDLLSQYKSAVDTEREATDEASKFTAAGVVKDLIDALNKALEAAGLSVKITVPSDKPEAPAGQPEGPALEQTNAE